MREKNKITNFCIGYSDSGRIRKWTYETRPVKISKDAYYVASYESFGETKPCYNEFLLIAYGLTRDVKEALENPGKFKEAL